MWLILPVVTAVMVLLALWESRYFYRGKHRGVFVKSPDWYPSLKPVEPYWVFKDVHITIPHGLGAGPAVPQL